MSYARKIVEHLGGEWHRNFGLAPGPGHSKSDRSLKIAPHSSDADDVVVYSFVGDDVLELKRAWREEGLLASKASAPICAKAGEQPEPDADEEARKQRIISWLWRQSEPAGAIIKAYLRSRGIELTARPNAIRFLPARPPKHPYPAMIVPFGIPDELEPGIYAMPPERIQGLHLSYLKPDGSGKAPVDPQRRIIGSPKGTPLALMPPNDGPGLIVGEGIETALYSYTLAGEGLGCWAAGNAPLMPALADAVPDYIEVVTIARDRDPAGQRATKELAHRLNARGIETIMARA